MAKHECLFLNAWVDDATMNDCIGCGRCGKNCKPKEDGK